MAERNSLKLWVHLSELGGDSWILPVWAAVNAAVSAGRAKQLTQRLKELGGHISLRLNFIPQVVQRINEGTTALNSAVAARPSGHEFSPSKQAYALQIDRKLKYRLLIDIDSLLFELNSLYELWCELFKALHVHASKNMPLQTANESIRHIITASGGDSSWLDVLDRDRNYFMHRGAPYVAVDVTRKNYDLLFLRNNVADLSATNDFVRLSELDSMIQGFRKTKPLIRDYLVGLYA